MKWLFEFSDTPTDLNYPITGHQIHSNGSKKGPYHFTMDKFIEALQSQPDIISDFDGLRSLEKNGPVLPYGTIRYSQHESNGSQRVTLEIPQKQWDIRYGDEENNFFNIGFPRMVIQFAMAKINDTTMRIAETRIYAVENDGKPIRENTQLYAFPYPNVERNTSIVCWGGNERLVINDLVELERLFQWFVAAPFGEDYGVRTTHGISSFKKLLEVITDKPFNDEWLMPLHEKFGDLFEQ